MFAPAIVAFAGIAFGIFVGQHRPLGPQHVEAHDIFAGDQLNLVHLAIKFVVDGIGNRSIGGPVGV